MNWRKWLSLLLCLALTAACLPAALADGAEQILYAEVDLPAAAAARKRKPYTSLRRPELYE